MSKASTEDDAVELRSYELSILSKPSSTLMQLTKAVESLEKTGNLKTVKFGVSSSVSVEALHLYLRAQGLLSNVHINVISGNYDDPIGDVERFKEFGVQQMVFLPFFDNLLPSFESRLETMCQTFVDAKEDEFRQSYRLAFEKAQSMQAIYLGTFHRLGNSSKFGKQDKVGLTLARFNKALREEAAVFKNIFIIDFEEVLGLVGQTNAFDLRFYFQNKAPYSRAFMKEISRIIDMVSRGFGTYFYKALALDCDNTLWGGVIGEDMLKGIKLDPHEYPGNVFWRVQHEFSSLERQGIILVLLSKNNPDDVDEVFRKHPHIVIKEEQIVAKRVNWKDKALNLEEISSELNLGLESIIFIDDSAFECESMRKQLPMVKTKQVPTNLSEYPSFLDEIKTLLLSGGITSTNINKTEQYLQLKSAQRLRAQSGSMEKYLESLELKVELYCDSHVNAWRISELSLKTNQFNLTNRRYTLSEIEQKMNDQASCVYSIIARDKFGNAGLTGVVVMKYEEDKAVVENFYLSCRILGRGIENCIWSQIATDAVKRGCNYLEASYVPSEKNDQVSDFYDRLGFSLIKKCKNEVHKYLISIAEFAPPQISYIEMTYGR
jgi:FkbH-like protein